MRSTIFKKAQIQVSWMSKAKTLEIKFAYKFIIPTAKSKGNMLNCTTMSGKYLVVADKNNRKLRIFNTKNTTSFEFPTNNKPFDVVGMDVDIVVSYGDQNYIEIIRLSSKRIQKRNLGNSCLGLSVCDRNVFVITYPKGITVLNDQSDGLREILMDVEGVYFLSVHSERLLYSSWKLGEGILFCSNMSGQQIWQLKFRSPHGVSFDRYGNIFVAENDSNEVYVISSDGKKHENVCFRRYCESHKYFL